ncbi:MAG: TerB family tellurite resistance protein [Gammaproteobacteria bacterium]|nr:TerB family tellurite resistance protein [Gammaproteobacteria bacterium]
MIAGLKALLRELAAGPGPVVSPDQVPLAMAALLIEAARADFNVKEEELRELGTLLALRLELEPDAAQALVRRARAAVENSVSLDEFTRPLNEALDYTGRSELIHMLWLVALADRRLDKYEDYLVSKVAELLYVSRGDVLRMKHRALQQLGGATGGSD